MNLPDIKFGKLIYKEHEGKNVYVHSYSEVESDDYNSYIEALTNEGYEKKENYMIACNSFTVHEKEDTFVLAVYYPTVKEMRIITSLSCSWQTYEDNPCDEKTECLLTQINIEDHGMSYLLRLSDGRFIIFDGGWEFDIDADKLFACMKEQSPHDKPIIASWIMTHPHIDHYRCYLSFNKKYAQEVRLQSFIYNFPDTTDDDIKKMPDLDTGSEHEYLSMRRFYDAVCQTGAPVYRAHTGQIFNIGNAKLEILSSPDDTFFVPVTSFNPLSLVIRMTIENQTILWCADASFEEAKLAERWGTYLKSDILQVPHHGFCGGDAKTYNLIDPTTCFYPVEEICFANIDIYREHNRHLLYNLNVEDCFTSTVGNLTVKLPYYPRKNGRRMLLDTVREYEKNVGAKSWYFEGLSRNECDFTFINSVAADADIMADLIFEDPSNNVNAIKIISPAARVLKANILNPEDADHDALYNNRASLKKRGLPKDAIFTVHFRSNVPVVIKGRKEEKKEGNS